MNIYKIGEVGNDVVVDKDKDTDNNYQFWYWEKENGKLREARQSEDLIRV